MKMRGPRASEGELYAADEVELLLDEIRHLEPTSCPPEELQDFEIAGSGCGSGGSGGAAGDGGGGGAAGGGRSPARTEASWDSHAQYRAPPPPALAPRLRCYCRPAPAHLLPALVLVCSLVSACVVWGALGLRLSGGGGGGAGAGAGRARAQAAQFGALTSALAHGALLAARVSRLHRQMPLPWHLTVVCTCWWSCGWLAGGGAALLAAARPAPPAPPASLTAAPALYTAAGFSAAGSLISLFLALATLQRYRARRRGEARPPL